jgi:hypothetical protein
MTGIERYVDKSMFPAAPMQQAGVHLLHMNSDPLGSIAAACRMYEGKPTYSLEDITDDERRHYWGEVQLTHLQAPLEFVTMHFFLEGVTRSFTHQHVRQRTAVFAQESLRFAVKEGMADEAILPPSVIVAAGDMEERWRQMLEKIEDFYNWCVANGIPAEDARDILPHCVATRLHYHTNLRNLVEHAGNRLCTQAQFHWRRAFAGIVNAIRNYNALEGVNITDGHVYHRWQFETIASSGLFRPVCFQKGNCPFNASFDRGCTIRGRVEANARVPRPSSEWDQPWGLDGRVSPPRNVIDPIRAEEWLLDPQAAFQ